MPDTILGGDFTIFPSTENNRKAIKWTGSSTGTRTARALYSALEAWAALPGSIGQLVPIKADTPDIFRVINQWFIDDETVEHITGGSIYTDKWKDGTTEHVLVIGYGQTTEFDAADIGRTIRGATTGDTGTILDFNATRKLLWIRPDDPASGGDEFDNGAESYAIGVAADGDAVAKCFQDDGGAFTDLTTEVNNATANDVIFPATEAISDALDFGFALKFSKLRLNVGTAGDASGVVVWEYYNGTTWAALAGVSDGTNGLETSGTNNLTFTVPSDWATTSISGSAQLYYIRVRITTVFGTTNPAITQGWISGVGVGAFATHNRHGVASKAGESAWVGLTTKGTLEANTHQYASQESPDSAAGSFDEKLVVATKGTSDWWGDGRIDILLKVKEADSVFGQLPNSSPATAVASVFARQYTKNYAHSIETALATAGGNTVAPLSTTDDGDNTVGPRNLIWDAGSSETLVDQELLYNVGTTTAGNLDAGVQDDGGVFTNDTTDLNDVAGGGDVAVFPATEATNDAFYFGKDNVFTLLMVDIATQGVSSAAATAWEYYNGSTWAALTVTDDSNSGNGAFTAATGRRLISWAAPSDWARVAVTNQPATAPAKLYYVRVRITAANYSTVPALETAWCGGEAQLKARVADAAIGTPGGATGDANYYLLGDPLVDFSDNDVVIAATSRKTININGAPTNTTGGPAADDSNLTAVHGQFTRDIDENGVVDPYSIDIQNSTSLAVQRVYEWTKFVTRQGATATTDTDEQQGQFYIGAELQVEYNTQAGGAFTQSRWVYDQTTDAKGFIVADHDDGATGDLILRTVRGTFTAGNVLSDSPDPTQAMNTNSFCYQVDGGAAEAINAIVDQSADALDAGAGDVTIFPASEDTNDYFAVGARKPFALVRFDNTGGTQGVGGTVTWQYWNGTTWAALSPTDGTTGFTAAVGVQTVTFYPPADWQARGLSSGTVNTPTLFFVRAKVSGTYSTNPIYDTVAVEDNVTATIGTVRSVAAIAAAPFGTYPGASKMFMAPGAAPIVAQMAAGEEQKYSTVDDNGTTRNPPNKQNMTVTNLVSGDTVSVYRRTGTVINTTQFTLAAGNNQGAATLVVSASIPADNPTSGKVRVVSPSGQHHRYRYASFASATFTLATGVVGGTSDGGSSSATRLHATAGSPFSAAEVGDYVRNTTEGKIVRITNVVDANNVDTEAVTSWSGDGFDYNVLMENYGTPNAYVPPIERIATATSHSATLTYSSDIDVRIDVRRNAATAILPFTQDSTFSSTGLSIAAQRNTDEITT